MHEESYFDVSIVIPAFNEEKYIENSLASLISSEQKTDIRYEVILVDNNSEDKTVEIAKKFQKDMNLKIITEKKQGRGAARARGFMEAKAKIILSADSDTIFYDNWIEIMSSEIKGDVVGTTTGSEIYDCSPLINMIYNFFLPKLMLLYRIVFGNWWLSGYSFGILKSVYEASGGFDPSLQAQEDSDLSFKVLNLGKIKFINKPVIFSGRRFKNGFLTGFYGYVKTFIKFFIFRQKNIYLDNPR